MRFDPRLRLNRACADCWSAVADLSPAFIDAMEHHFVCPMWDIELDDELAYCGL